MSMWDMGGHFVEENTLTVNIRRLRRKLEMVPPWGPDILKRFMIWDICGRNVMTEKWTAVLCMGIAGFSLLQVP